MLRRLNASILDPVTVDLSISRKQSDLVGTELQVVVVQLQKHLLVVGDGLLHVVPTNDDVVPHSHAVPVADGFTQYTAEQLFKLNIRAKEALASSCKDTDTLIRSHDPHVTPQGFLDRELEV